MKKDSDGQQKIVRRISGPFVVLLFLMLPVASLYGAVKIGADLLVERHLDLLRGKRVGIVTNHTGRLSTGEFLVDVLRDHGITVVALFGPEHGVRGEVRAGETVRDTIDPRTGIPVFSLYGTISKPTPGMLTAVDVLIYDIQDVGARFYTFISTMALAMEAAAEHGIPFIVLDRPNPLGGLLIDGPVMEDSLRSFVGMFPIPIVYGLTCGELATMINQEGWLAEGKRADLVVIHMERWTRRMLWEETGLTWYPPSPNIPLPASAMAYPATCIVEATNLSEGRGTSRPFQLIGAPFVDGVRLCDALDSCRLPGVRFRQAAFVPAASKFQGDTCRGICIEVTENSVYRPTLVGLSLLREGLRLFPTDFRISRKSFLRLAGSATAFGSLSAGVPPMEIESAWLPKLEAYRAKASQYRVYPID